MAGDPAVRTETTPEMIVIYDGFNDVMAEMGRGVPACRRASRLTVAAVKTPAATSTPINKRSAEFLKSDIGPTGEVAAEGTTGEQAELSAAAPLGIEVDVLLPGGRATSAEQLAPYQAINGIPTEMMAFSPIALPRSTLWPLQLEPGVTNLSRPALDNP